MLGEAMPHSNYSSAPSSPTASSTSSSEITPVGTITTDRIPAYKAVSCSTPRTPRTAPANFLSSPQRSPIALSPDITIRGYPRDEGRRSRASSCVTSVHPHRHVSPFLDETAACIDDTYVVFRRAPLDHHMIPSSFTSMHFKKQSRILQL